MLFSRVHIDQRLVGLESRRDSHSLTWHTDRVYQTFTWTQRLCLHLPCEYKHICEALWKGYVICYYAQNKSRQIDSEKMRNTSLYVPANLLALHMPIFCQVCLLGQPKTTVCDCDRSPKNVYIIPGESYAIANISLAAALDLRTFWANRQNHKMSCD